MGALDYKTRRHRRNRLAAELAATYHPRKHFRLGQDIGWHWQFDDPLKRVGIPYEWTDTAGTTPVTAVGQGIGLLLGREYGGATGPSLLANGTTGLTGTATAASYNTSTFAGSVSRAGDASNQSWVTWTGLTTSAVHRIRITNTGATSLDVRNGGVAGTIVASIAAGASTWVHPATTGGSTSITITATANSTTATFTLGQFAVLPGTHLIQATGTAKPTLSARVNLLTKSEQFDDAAWLKTTGAAETSQGTGLAAVVTANHGTAPNGTTTADRLQLSLSGGANAASGTNRSGTAQNITVVSGVGYKLAIYLKALDGTNLATLGYGAVITVGLAAGGTITYGTPQSVGDGWFVVTGTCTTASTIGTWRIQLVSSPGSTLNTLDLLVWGADLRTADDAAKNIPAYQRVGATATDHDTDGFPHYALADGTDDCWASVSTVDGSATDKLSMVTAFTKNSDAAQAALIEHGTSVANVAEWGLSAPSSAGATTITLIGRSSSGSTIHSGENPSGFSAPLTGVVADSIDWAAVAGVEILQWVNGARTTTYFNGTQENTGVFGNKTLNVLSRAGTSFRFNGRFYGSTGRFGPMSDSERNNLTRWWQKRIGTA